MKILTCIFFFFIVCEIAHSQSLEDFNDVLISLKIGKTVTKKSGKDISQRTYIGTITDSMGISKYFVVKEFLKVQAAIVYHGNSRILFFDRKNKLVATYNLNLPCELPYKLYQNTLYFHYCDDINKINKVEISVKLPNILCVAPSRCYDKEVY
ncbi:MAG TPA: hypothetical protein VK718_10240 [Ferruginibacter sp.]|jgi:hypothetical protein|nr:hypothetical protein [Ferruginibacter sp.]